MYILCNGFQNGKENDDQVRKMRRVKIDPLDAKTILDLRIVISKTLNKSAESLVLMHGGHVLQDDQPLSIFEASSTIHVIPRPMEPGPAVEDQRAPLTDEEVQLFVLALGLAIRSPAFIKVTQRLNKRKNLESLVAAVPSLSKDLVACAFLSRPELLVSLLEPETLKYVHQKHPGLFEAAQHLAAAVHEDATQASSGNDEELEGQGSFLMNAEYSDEDDDEEMNPGSNAAAVDRDPGQAQQQPRRQAQNYSAITPNQLAAAITAAQQAAGFMGGMTGMMGNHPHPSTSSTGTSTMSMSPSPSPGRLAATARAGASLITQDQLAAALAAAAPLYSSSSTLNAGSDRAAANFSATDSEISQQLATMREMGITDDSLSRRALMVMNGDLQAAIDLIFSGWLGDDN